VDRQLDHLLLSCVLDLWTWLNLQQGRGFIRTFVAGSIDHRSTEENTERTMAAELLYRWMLRCSATKEEI
jgi:hypothetical protein